MEKLLVVKVGGKVVENASSLQVMLARFAAHEGRKVLVHGGGVMATSVARAMGVDTTMVEGRRITGDKMIDVVTMVYGGLVNKRIVAMLECMGLNAVGLCGADMNIMLSSKRPVVDGIDYGWVGDVKRVDAHALSTLVETGVVPVLAPLTHDGKGHILNTNADTIAAETARSLASCYDVTLVYCFEKNGVLLDPGDDGSVIASLQLRQFQELKASGIINQGMIPKLSNAFKALQSGVREVVITSVAHLDDLSQGTHLQ